MGRMFTMFGLLCVSLGFGQSVGNGQGLGEVAPIALTKARFDRIRGGMTLFEVMALLGPRAEINPKPPPFCVAANEVIVLWKDANNRWAAVVFVPDEHGVLRVLNVELKGGTNRASAGLFNYDPYVRIEDTDGRPLATSDDMYPWREMSARLVFTPPTTSLARLGEYRLIVSKGEFGNNYGRYVLRIHEAGKSREPEVIRGELRGGETPMHIVQLERGQAHVIEMKSDGFNGKLALRDADGYLGKVDAFTPESGASYRLDFTPLKYASERLGGWSDEPSDRFRVQVEALRSGQKGKYTITLHRYDPMPKVFPSPRAREGSAALPSTHGEEGLGVREALQLSDDYLELSRIHEAIQLLERLRAGRTDAESLEVLEQLAYAWWLADRMDRASAIQNEVVRISGQKFPGQPRHLLAVCNLATAQFSTGEWRMARGELQAAVNGEWPKDRGRVFLARYDDQLRFDRAKLTGVCSELEVIEKHLATTLGNTHPCTLALRNNLGVAYAYQGRWQEAQTRFEDVEKTYGSIAGVLKIGRIAVLDNTAAAWLALGQPLKASGAFNAILEHDQRCFGIYHPRTETARTRLNAPFAAARNDNSYQFKLFHGRLDHWPTQWKQALHGSWLLATGEFADAEDWLRDAYDGLKTCEADIPPGDRRCIAETIEQLIQLYQKWGKEELEQIWRRRLLAETHPQAANAAGTVLLHHSPVLLVPALTPPPPVPRSLSRNMLWRAETTYSVDMHNWPRCYVSAEGSDAQLIVESPAGEIVAAGDQVSFTPTVKGLYRIHSANGMCVTVSDQPVPYPLLAAVPPNSEATVRPRFGSHVRVLYQNRTKQPLRHYYLTPGGERRYIGAVFPGQVWHDTTPFGAVRVLADRDGRKIAMYHIGFKRQAVETYPSYLPAVMAPPRALPAALPKGNVGVLTTGWLDDKDAVDPIFPQSRHKVYALALPKDKFFNVVLKSREFDSYLRIEDAAGRLLSENDDGGGGGRDSRIFFHSPTDAEYRLVVSSYDGKHGAFALFVQEITRVGKARVIHGFLPAGEKKSPYSSNRLELQAFRNYCIEAISSDFDAALFVLNADRKQLAWDDNGGDNFNARLAFMPTSPGFYEIVVGALPELGGSYTLVIQECRSAEN